MNYQDMYGCNFESENVGRASNFEFRVSLGIRDLRMGVAFRILIIYYHSLLVRNPFRMR